MGKLDGQVAAVTRATGDVGAAVTEALVRAGASVVVNHEEQAAGKQLADRLDAGDRVSLHPGSVLDRSVVEGVVDTADDHYGQLDILVFGPGGVRTPAPLPELGDGEGDYGAALNMSAVCWGLRRARGDLAPGRTGRIVAISAAEGKV